MDLGASRYGARQGGLVSLLFTVDARDPVPLWTQIVRRVAGLVEDGTLTDGERLPSSRELAARLGVNRSTVCRAYEELWAGGYLESRQGSYSRIRTRTRALAPAAGERPAVDWARASSPGARKAIRPFLDRPNEIRAPSSALDLASLTADPDLCPATDLRRAVRYALKGTPNALLDYGDPAGFRPLRETLARRMRAHGIAVDAGEVLLTQGAQQALDLVLDLLVQPGGEVAIEVPTYGLMLSLLALHGATPVGVPMTPRGLDLDALGRRFARRRPALLYTVPNFQNPTGITSSQAHREQLIALCERYRVPILEDGFEEDMKYFGRAVLPIKSMDARGLVLYVGTFSKVVFPGLRVGWIAAGRDCVRRLTALNRVTSLSGNTVAQAAMDRFCHAGRYDAYLRRLHATYRRRMVALLKGLATRLPDGAATWTEPAGGCTLWLTVPRARPDDEARLVALCLESGVTVTPGRLFFPSAARALHLRLSIARIRSHQVDDACRRLGRAIGTLIDRSGRV
jgi:DNA-binding transcriptional MocR family regulator